MTEELSPADYRVLAELGRGTFSVVKCARLITEHPGNKLIAIKIYNREINRHRAGRILTEKDILLNRFRGSLIFYTLKLVISSHYPISDVFISRCTDHGQCPYVCEILATSKDSDNLYFYMPLYIGGPLHRQLVENRRMELAVVLGYMAELITAVLYIVSSLVEKSITYFLP